MKLKYLRARAATIGVRIEAERFDVPVAGNFWGYWLIDEKTNDGVWDDENYYSDHNQLSQALRKLEFERGVRCKAMMPF